MADRTVKVRVQAEMPGYAAAMKSAATSTVALGDAATVAGKGVRSLGVDADAAKGGLSGLAAGAKGGTAALKESELAALAASQGVKASGVEADAARGAFGRIGAAAKDGMESVKSGAEGALESVQHLGLLLAGGSILYGLHDIVEQGNEYTDAMNKFLEVTRASGAQMQAAGSEAQSLGADMKLPTASAAEAADAMVELAKAGLSAGDAIKAARGTIQLAAAARTDVATAAKIEGDIMDQFSLKASDASKVADTLANTSNSASGELMDIYYAMKYVGPVAHGMGISLQDAATAVGLLGKSGIIGETAGTALRSALVDMAKPTKQAADGLKELGIQAFDSQGNFKGLQYLITQLASAQKDLSNQQFAAAATAAFGKPALAAIVALAERGGPAFAQMSMQVGRAGGAAALAAAESKGLGGAMRTLGKELTSTFLQVYLGISPVLESITRGMSAAVSDAIPYVQRGIKTATDLWDIYGPSVEKKLQAAGLQIGKDAESWISPLEMGLAGIAGTTIPLAITGFTTLGTVFGNLEKALTPIDSGFQDVFTSVTSGAGALGVFEGRVQEGLGMLGTLSGVLGPIGSLVGGLAHAFAGLPGPIQLSVISMLAMRPFQPQIQAMKQSVTDFGKAGIDAFKGIGDASLYQRVLAAGAGQELGKFGGYVAALEARSPALAAMGNAFRGVTSSIDPAASGMERFGGTLKGLSAAAGVGALTGLKSAASGLLGVFGGGWGLAVGGAMTLLDYFAQKSKAAQQQVDSFTNALQQDSGALGTNTRALAAQTLQQQGLFDIGTKYGIQQGVLTDAALGNAAAIKQVNDALQKNATTQQVTSKAQNEMGTSTTVLNGDAQKLRDTIDGTSSSVAKAAQAYKNQELAMDQTASPTDRLNALIKTLGSTEADSTTKTDALHQALQLLSGGELDVEAAAANQNQAIIDLNSSYKDGVDKANGYGKALLQADGSLNTLTPSGQNLWNLLQSLSTATAGMSEATFNYAKNSGQTLPQALKAAEGPMQTAWEQAVKAGEQYGLTAAQAKELAAQMQFIPSNLAITLGVSGFDATTSDLMLVAGYQGHLDQGATIHTAAITDQATKDLQALGFKVATLPNRQVEITIPDTQAFNALNGIINKLNSVQSRTVDVTVAYHSTGNGRFLLPNADGNIYPGGTPTIRRFANGGEDHSAQIAPGGAWRMWAEPETGGEAYIPLGASKRPRSKALLEQVARMMGGRVAWFAGGGISAFAGGGFSYTPNIPALGGASDPMTRYDNALKALQAAWAKLTAALAAQAKAADAQAATRKKEDAYVTAAEKHLEQVRSGRHTHAQLIAAETELTKARQLAAAADQAAAAKTTAAAKATAAARASVNAADVSLGVAKGSAAPTGFDLAAYEKQLSDSLSATEDWRKNLSAVGARGGAAVEQILQNMGADGTALTAALAKASKKDFDTIVKNLQAVSDQAKATLADFDSQVAASAKTNSQFAADLASLSARGYGALAQQLAQQGDQSAMDLAREAAGASASQLAKINADVTSQNNTLTGTDLQNMVLVLSTLRSKPGEGISDVVAAGISVADLLTLVPKIRPQIDALPDDYKRQFLAQMAGQGTATAMATGGILTQPTLVLGGEAGVAESWIPLNGSARSQALLGASAAAMGYRLVPAGRFAAHGDSGATVHHHNNQKNITLNGAKQSTAEQAADLMRHMVALT
ncbi:phage tail tape measure protein [Streptacidiphilus melanogenes]|uniref:phage tail tape measure protein n=1 Tax=Streptacidiphilus melanogenes TaxID=411235 RepID=UPI0005A64628|nr:phage tail tape measure protein [Streptacidiphilus melanogenes]